MLAFLARLMQFLDDADTERRIAGTIAAVALPVINQHLPVPLSSELVISGMVACMGYVMQSAVKAILKPAAPKVATVDAAVAALAGVK